MPIKLKKNVQDYINQEYPEAGQRYKDKLFKKMYETASQSYAQQASEKAELERLETQRTKVEKEKKQADYQAAIEANKIQPTQPVTETQQAPEVQPAPTKTPAQQVLERGKVGTPLVTPMGMPFLEAANKALPKELGVQPYIRKVSINGVKLNEVDYKGKKYKLTDDELKEFNKLPSSYKPGEEPKYKETPSGLVKDEGIFGTLKKAFIGSLTSEETQDAIKKKELETNAYLNVKDPKERYLREKDLELQSEIQKQEKVRQLQEQLYASKDRKERENLLLKNYGTTNYNEIANRYEEDFGKMAPVIKVGEAFFKGAESDVLDWVAAAAPGSSVISNEQSPELYKKVKEEARDLFPIVPIAGRDYGVVEGPVGALRGFIFNAMKRKAYRANQYWNQRYGNTDAPKDNFEENPTVGNLVYSGAKNLAELYPAMVAGGMAAEFLGAAQLETLGAKYAEKLAAKQLLKGRGTLAKVQKFGVEYMANLPKNAGALYQYSFDRNVSDLVDTKGYDINNPDTYSRAANMTNTEMLFEGVFDQFKFFKEAPELAYGLTKGGKKQVAKQLVKNTAKGMAAGAFEEAAQTAATLPFNIEDSERQIAELQKMSDLGLINPEEANQKIGELKITIGKATKQILGSAAVGAVTPVMMNVPRAVGYSISPIETKALKFAVHNQDDFTEAVDNQVANKSMTEDEGKRLKGFVDQTKNYYDYAITSNAPENYTKATGRKTMKSDDAMKMAVELARLNSFAKSLVEATDPKEIKEIQNNINLSRQAVKNIVNNTDIGQRRVSSNEIASIISGSTPVGAFTTSQAKKIVSKPAFQQEVIENEKELFDIVANDPEIMAHVLAIRQGKMKVSDNTSGNVVLDENNRVIDGKKRIAQMYVDAVYGNTDEIDRMRGEALGGVASPTIEYYKRKLEQDNFASEDEKALAQAAVNNPIQHLEEKVNTLKDTMIENPSPQVMRDLDRYTAELEQVRQATAQANEQAEQGMVAPTGFLKFAVSKAVSNEGIVNTAIESMQETPSDDLVNSYTDINQAIAANVNKMQQAFVEKKKEIEQIEDKDLSYDAWVDLLNDTVYNLALTGVNPKDLITTLANVTGISTIQAESVVKMMAQNNQLPNVGQIEEYLTKLAEDIVTVNKEEGIKSADLTEEQRAAIKKIDEQTQAALNSIPGYAEAVAQAKLALTSNSSEASKIDGSVLLNDPVAYFQAMLNDLISFSNQSENPEQFGEQINEATQLLEAVTKVMEASEAAKEKVYNMSQPVSEINIVEPIDEVEELEKEKQAALNRSKLLNFAGARRIIANQLGSQQVINDAISYLNDPINFLLDKIEALQMLVDTRIDDAFVKYRQSEILKYKKQLEKAQGIIGKYDEKIAKIKQEQLDKATPKPLQENKFAEQMADWQKNNVPNKEELSPRQRRAYNRKVAKEITQNLTNIFNQMGVERPQELNEKCP